MAELRAVRLRCEHRENPLGIGETRPRFSWVLQSDDRDVMQEGWQIQVDRTADFLSPAWDTGTVASDQSVLVPYDGPALASATRYYWRVRVSARGAQGALEPHGSLRDDAPRRLALARRLHFPAGGRGGRIPRHAPAREVMLPEGFVSARVYATALGMYELSINGAARGRRAVHPGLDLRTRRRLLYQAWDVTGLLRRGANAIAATLGCGWYKGDLAGWLGRRNVYGTRTALLLQVLVRYTDGREAADRAPMIPGKRPRGPILYSELYHGETYDARRERRG